MGDSFLEEVGEVLDVAVAGGIVDQGIDMEGMGGGAADPDLAAATEDAMSCDERSVAGADEADQMVD